MKYICTNCGYSQEELPISNCPECGATNEYFLSEEYIRKKADERIRQIIDNPSTKTKELFRKLHYRVSYENDCCANCSHMELLDSGTYRERCLCVPMDYFFTNNDKNKAHICDSFSSGSRMDALLDEMAALILANPSSDTKSEKREERKPKEKASEGCYIATAVYGSYDCPQVWTLRRFRDNTLKTSLFGRAFIKAYYAISPFLVKHFSHISWMKRITRKFLDAFVGKLRENGVDDCPYKDKKQD